MSKSGDRIIEALEEAVFVASEGPAGVFKDLDVVISEEKWASKNSRSARFS